MSKETKYYGEKLPDCGICKQDYFQISEASYDANTKLNCWAYLCENCFTNYGKGLGTGLGQKLILTSPQKI